MRTVFRRVLRVLRAWLDTVRRGPGAVLALAACIGLGAGLPLLGFPGRALAQPTSAVCGGVTVPAWVTAGRPSSPNDQTAGFNLTAGYCEIYQAASSAWQPLAGGSVAAPAYVIAGGTAPTIAAGTGAGTGPTVSVLGTGNAQIITVVTGTSPSASAVIATVTLPFTCPFKAVVSLFPANSATAVSTLVSPIYVALLATGYTLNAGTVAMGASTTFKWTAHVDCY